MMSKQAKENRERVGRDHGNELRVGWGTFRRIDDEQLRLAKQLGIRDILITTVWREEVDTTMPTGRGWTLEEIEAPRDKIEDHGLELYAFENLPISLYRILLEPESFDENIEEITKTIRNVGEAKIDILGYSGLPPGGPVRTDKSRVIRGGSTTSAYDGAKASLSDTELNRSVSEEELWKRYESFLANVLPVAEEAGVTLAVHPSDPPVPDIDGLPLLFRDRDSFERALGLVESSNHGLKLCLGCWSEMGEDIPNVIQHFQDDIVYVHFRDVVGSVPQFYETFIDDPESNFDEFDAMQELRRVGFRGVVTPDHVPRLDIEKGSEHGGSIGKSFTVGYLKGLIRGTWG